MAKTRIDPEQLRHREWLGYVQPVGLVVSPPALLKAQAVLDRRRAVDRQQLLNKLVRRPEPVGPEQEVLPYIDNFPRFAEEVLEWLPEDLAGAPGGPDLPDDLEVVLPDYGEHLRPTYGLVDPDDSGKFLLLIKEEPLGRDLDAAPDSGAGWQASPHARLERLLREREIPVGLAVNGHALRLVYAPRGESSGHVTFRVKDMCEVAGRPILAALDLLLSAFRLMDAPEGRRLADLLAESRKYQNDVSTRLADQVQGALWELLRGFQAADEAAGGALLSASSGADPDHIYGGLLTTLMRLVFLLYAEDNGLMPDDEVFSGNYSVAGLYGRLREDAGAHPDTMDDRHGAWAWLVSLFRLVYDGGGHQGFMLPARQGQLFDPDAYPFLEGRPRDVARVMGQKFEPPRVPDGCVHRVLESLLVLDGERLSYRALDVEQIGSVYEAMMGFEVQRSAGRALGVRKRHKGMSLDIVFDLDELLQVPAGKRGKWLKDHAETDIKGLSLKALKEAEGPEDVIAALGRRLSPRTPQALPPGAMYLQPGEERRRTGSHYTPRELTGPIVEKALEPVLEALGPKPTPEQILELKVCDPAMGSGAFLVEACRQLADRLLVAWEVHDRLRDLDDDEEPLLIARRQVARHCLYGVDKNPFAVDLAKLSLWLITLSADRPFTFLDHSLKYGDSLVGLTRDQIRAFTWELAPSPQIDWVLEGVDDAARCRQDLRNLDERQQEVKRVRFKEAEEALHDARLVGDLVVAAFFAEKKDKNRKKRLGELRERLDAWRTREGDVQELEHVVAELREGERPLPPFHWEIEFPEVFRQNSQGFNAVVGNPPFLGGAGLSKMFGGPEYQEWLKQCHENAFGNADLSAYFYRKSFDFILSEGTFGLLATNSVSEGATRTTGLQTILKLGGQIYNATRSQRWPGTAAVYVAVVHMASRNACVNRPILLDGVEVSVINSRLRAQKEIPDPVALSENNLKGFFGVGMGGSGFILGQEEHDYLARQPRNQECLLPFLGGEEVNRSPTQSNERYAIWFGSKPLSYAEKFPELLEIVSERVRPQREKAPNHGPGKHGKKYWWQYTLRRDPMYESIRDLSRCIVTARTTTHLAFSFQPVNQVFSESLVAFAFDDYASFSCLQSRVHSVWAHMLSSYMKNDLRYSVKDAFQTFPFPSGFDENAALLDAGRDYYRSRARLMVRMEEGLTKTYNRFHNPDECSSDIVELRELHDRMDRAVLDAYGWSDLANVCEFLLDYEIDEEEWGTRRKPHRYRWSQEMQEKVLDRLLSLNQKRAEEERLAGLTATPKPKKKGGRKKKSKSLSLFDDK